MTNPTPPAPAATDANAAPTQPTSTPTAPAPAATPATAPATGAPGTGTVTPAAGEPAAAPQPAGHLTQEQFDKALTKRLADQQKAFNEKITKLFGNDTEGDGKPSPDDVLAKAQQFVEQAQSRANAATARAFVQGAQIKSDRVGTLLGMVDLKGALANVDANDGAAVDAAIKAAVAAKVAEFPEWKQATVPGSSTANPNGAPGTPDLDAQIAKAEGDKDFRTAIRLKRERAAQRAG